MTCPYQNSRVDRIASRYRYLHRNRSQEHLEDAPLTPTPILCTAVTERDMTNSWAHRLIPAFRASQKHCQMRLNLRRQTRELRFIPKFHKTTANRLKYID